MTRPLMRCVMNCTCALVYSISLVLLQSAYAQSQVQSPDAMSAENEARYKAIASELRCLVCQNQTLFDSTSALAGDLRQQVHEQIAQGKSDDAIKHYMVERYGDFILYKPPVKATTWLLWGLPFVLLLIGAGVVFSMVRKSRSPLSVTDATKPQEQNLDQARAWLDEKN